jgi:hypothetical protein
MILWFVLLVLIIAIFIFINAIILPKIFLVATYKVSDSADRGIKTIDEVGGRSVIYAPNLDARKYIEQYILSERGGKKYIICKFNCFVKTIDYDVVLFGGFGEVCKVINVQEIAGDNYVSKPVEIPAETAYATVIVNAANGKKFKSPAVKSVTLKRLVWYSVCCAISIAACVLCVKYCLAKLFGGLFDEIFLVSLYSNLVTVLLAIILIILNVLAAILIVRLKNQKIKGESGNG